MFFSLKVTVSNVKVNHSYPSWCFGFTVVLQYMVSLLLFLVTDMVFIASFAVLLDNVSTYFNRLHTYMYIYIIYFREIAHNTQYMKNYLWISLTTRLRIKILKVLKWILVFYLGYVIMASKPQIGTTNWIKLSDR